MWCWQERTRSWPNFVAALRRIVHADPPLWREFPEPTDGLLRFDTFTQYVTEFLEVNPKSLPYVIEGTGDGEFAAEVRTMLRQDEPKQNSQVGAPLWNLRNPDNIRVSQYGTNTSYIVRRLKRDHPELYQQVIDGTLKPSVAAVQAGFRRKVVQVRADDVQKAVNKLLEFYSPQDLLTALAQLQEEP